MEIFRKSYFNQPMGRVNRSLSDRSASEDVAGLLPGCEPGTLPGGKGGGASRRGNGAPVRGGETGDEPE